MKKIIALRGRSNIGKTSTIREVHGLLIKRYPNASSSYEIQGQGDIRMVLTINEGEIGIESQGDPGGRLKESLELFRQVGCHVIVCATRTRGETVEAVKSLRPDYEVKWLKQRAAVIEGSKGSEMQESNLKMAAQIVKEIEVAYKLK